MVETCEKAGIPIPDLSSEPWHFTATSVLVVRVCGTYWLSGRLGYCAVCTYKLPLHVPIYTPQPLVLLLLGSSLYVQVQLMLNEASRFNVSSGLRMFVDQRCINVLS